MGIFLKKKSESIEKKQYFSYIKKIKENDLISILNNSNYNNKIALQKKDFEKIRTIKLKQNDTLVIKDINWFTYISKYFNKKYKEGLNWYKNIIDKIYEKNYLYEMQYQSYIFYKDFEMKYKSTSLKNFDNEKERDETDKEEEILSLLTKNTMIDLSRNSRMDLSGITDNYGGSFADFKDEMDLIDDDLGIKAKKKLKQFIKILKRHLNMEDHPINIIISIFCHQFSHLIKNQIEAIISMKKKNETDIDKKIKYFSDLIVDELKRFIIKIQTSTKLFYCKAITLDFFIEEKDELINLVTSIIFQKSDIYNNIYSLFTIQYQKEINDFKYKLLLVKDTKPIDLNIPDKLSLDENTTKEILKIKEKNKLKDEKEYLNNNNKIFIPEDGHIKGFHDKNKINGYNTVVKMIYGLKHAKTPFDKMIIIASMSTEITQCVDMYWNNMDNYLPNYYLSINADEFLSLFILIVIRAQFPELIIHEKIIQNFTTKTTKNSTIGYYNVTLNAAIEYIQNEATENTNNNNNNSGNGLRNSAHLISKYLNQNFNNKENKNNEEFVLIDSKGINFNSNISDNIININSNQNINNNNNNSNINNNQVKSVKSKKNHKKHKSLLGIEEDDKDEKNFELSIKNYD